MVFALITDVENRICGLCRDYIPSCMADVTLIYEICRHLLAKKICRSTYKFTLAYKNEMLA